MTALNSETLQPVIHDAVMTTKITDVHTHLYPPSFGELLLWGVDELVTYHYLIAETMRWISMPYENYWRMSRQQRADLIWRVLFLENSPYSESCRGVLTTLQRLGLDVASRDLASFRRFFEGFTAEQYVDRVFELAGVREVVMTNDPFDDVERARWMSGAKVDPRFRAALRLDTLLNSWALAQERLAAMGVMKEGTHEEIRVFLTDWIKRTGALYMAVSLPPSFRMPAPSPRATLIEQCVLPVSRELNVPFAMMIGVKKLTNPALQLAGDSVGKGDIDTVEYLCAHFPRNKFLVTMLARENQHELAVAARKFRNLMPFGCWWFLNNPSLVEEITRMRTELLGVSFIPQHSDARVLDQLIYKWEHSRRIIEVVLQEKYRDLLNTGWVLTEEEVRRDIGKLLGGNFWSFLERRL